MKIYHRKTALMDLAVLSLFQGIAHAESLTEYAQKCETDVGVAVPSFTCDSGTTVPGNTPNASGQCENLAFLGGHVGSGQYQIYSDLTNKCATYEGGLLIQYTCSDNVASKIHFRYPSQ